MNKDWCDINLTRLYKLWPSWITSLGCFPPTDEFYSQFSKIETIPSIVTSICQYAGLNTKATLDIVHDSDDTALDFITGRRFDHREIDSAADVFSKSSFEMRIRLAVRQLASPRKLARILTHEAMHHFLNVANVHAESEIEEEMLTDLTGIFLGFGKIMLNSAVEEPLEIVNTPLHISEDGIPYLGYPLFAYSYFLWSKQNEFTTEQTFENVKGPCVRFLRNFEYYHGRGKGFFTRILARLRGIPPEPDCDGSSIFEQCRKRRSISFNIILCRSCGSSLRIPKTEKKLLVTCPKCKNKFTVHFKPLTGKPKQFT
jgi:hypothetical protein